MGRGGVDITLNTPISQSHRAQIPNPCHSLPLYKSAAMLALGEEKRKVEAEHKSFSAKMTDEMVARDRQLGKVYPS